jgi:O-antigen ligase
MVVVFQDSILARLSADDRGAAYSRIPLMQMAYNIIRDHPVFGVGSNNYAAVLKDYVTPEFSGDFIYTVHNKYLIVWSETGLAGLAAFVSFLLMTVRRGWQGWQIKDRLLSSLAMGFTAGVIGQMIHMFVDLFKSRPQVQLLWFVAAVIVAIYFMDRESKRESRDVATF